MPWVAWVRTADLSKWSPLPKTSRWRDSVIQLRAYCEKHQIHIEMIEWVVMQEGRKPGGPSDIRKGEIPMGEFPVDWAILVGTGWQLIAWCL